MLFKLTEYADAERVFLDAAINALTISRGGIYAQARHVPGRLSTTRLTLEDGGTFAFEPTKLAAQMTIQKDDIISGRVGAVVEMADAAAGEFHEAVEKEIFASLDRLTTATGNRVDAAGKDLNDAMYEMFEKLELTFEDDGSISPGFAIFASPEMAERLGEAEASRTEEQKRRFDELIDRKRKEFFAQRRRRELS